MHTQQSGSSRLSVVRVNFSKFTLEQHENNLFKRQKQLLTTLRYLKVKRPEDHTKYQTAIHKALTCGRVLLQDKSADKKILLDGEMPGPYRWAHACRQTRWCSRCAAIERESKAVKFSESARLSCDGGKTWAVVISPDRPDNLPEMINRAELLKTLLSDFTTGYCKKSNLSLGTYAAGLHTQPQQHGLLWPHLHLLLVSNQSKSSKQAVLKDLQKWLDKHGINQVKVSARFMGIVNEDILPRNLSQLYRYITRPDDPEDGPKHPAVRNAVMHAIQLNRSYTASKGLSYIEPRRVGYPNNSLPKNGKQLISALPSKKHCRFSVAPELTPRAAMRSILENIPTALEA